MNMIAHLYSISEPDFADDKIVEITKDQARELLALFAFDSRPYSSDKLEKMVDDLNFDRWKCKADSYLIGDMYNCKMLEGRHRLRAFLLSDKTTFKIWFKFL